MGNGFKPSQGAASKGGETVSFKVTIPRLAIPGLTIKRGQLLNVTLFGYGVVVPPVDFTFWPEIELIPETVVFDSAWIWEWWYKVLGDKVDAIIQAMEEELK